MTFFPIPDEFYRDPQYLGWSAYAYALWTLAGSWSADRLTDGFVPTAALALFPNDISAAADELCERGVWRRARGGYRYAYWPKEVSRERVEAKREAERLKKRLQRAARRPSTQQDQRQDSSSDDVLSPGDTGGTAVGTAGGHPDRTPAPSSKPVTQGVQDQTPTGFGARDARTRGTRIPTEFATTDAMIAWARTHTPLVGRAETDSFIDYWTAASGRNAAKRDWEAAWRHWMRRAQADAERRPRTSAAGYQSQTDANIAAFLGGGSPIRRALPGEQP